MVRPSSMVSYRIVDALYMCLQEVPNPGVMSSLPSLICES